MDLAEEERDWVLASCTLPTQAVPLRLAEFDVVFGWVRAVQRPRSSRLLLLLEPAHGRADLVRDLASRESSCCSFFTFSVSEDDDNVVLQMTVPEGQLPVLDAVARRAAQVAGRGSGEVRP